MGYRSTVAYTIRFEGDDDTKAKQAFYTFLAEAKAKSETALCFTDEEHFTVDEAKMQIRFFASDVKWYESYEDVKCHEALMDLSREWADDGDCSSPFIGGALARIGEDMEDITEEVWGNGEYDWCAVRRYMECDWLE